MARARDNGRKRERILDAAVVEMAQHGYYHTTVAMIARRAGVADGTIYLYFQNKDDILISLFEVSMDAVIRNMREVLDREADPRKKIQLFAIQHLQMLETNKELAEVIQVELRQSVKFMKEYKNEKFLQYLNLVSDVVREGQEQGVFRKDIVPGVAKRAFFGALDEMSRYWVLSSKKKYDIRTAAEQISSLFIQGMTANAA